MAYQGMVVIRKFPDVIWIHIGIDEYRFVNRVLWMDEYMCGFSGVLVSGFIVWLIERE